jgi:hypothetical protein
VLEEEATGAEAFERSTLAVTMVLPGWVKRLIEFSPEETAGWLASCPIDELALALVDTEISLAHTFLERLEGPKREAVQLQMEFGKLLSKEERERASKRLESLLLDGALP